MPTNPFPVDVLPKVVQKYVTAICKEGQYDPAMVTLPLLSCLARAIGNKAVVKLESDWTEPAIVWSLIIAPSGNKKSVAFRKATDFLQRLHKEEVAKNGDRIITTDFTGPALWNRLDQNSDTSLLILKDELVAMLNKYGKSGSAKDTEKADLLASFNAEPANIDRVKVKIDIDRLNLNITGTIQPDVFVDAAKEHLTDGTCARFLLAEFNQEKPSKASSSQSNLFPLKYRMRSLFRELWEMPCHRPNGHAAPFAVRLSPAASTSFLKHRQHIDNVAYKTIDPHLRAAYSKLAGYTARFALIFALCEWASDPPYLDNEIDEIEEKEPLPLPVVEVSKETMQNAIKLERWFESEYVEIYAKFNEDKQDRLQRDLLDVIRRAFPNGASVRDIVNKAKKKFGKTNDVEKLMGGLVQDGHLRRQTIRTAGRPSERYMLMD